MKIFNKGDKMNWKPVAGIAAMTSQVNKRWPNRDKRSDGVLGDASHQARPSDHNPSSNGFVHAQDIDKDFRGSKNDSRWFADQLIAYARLKKPGSVRLKNVVFENQVASGTYADHYWTWRDGDYGHLSHIHISYSTQGEKDDMKFDIPILNGVDGVWDGNVPFYDVLASAAKSGSSNKATWRLACRLKELGFYEGTVQPEGKQAYPKNAIRAMQDYMGWKRREYDVTTHKAIWKELRLSGSEE